MPLSKWDRDCIKTLVDNIRENKRIGEKKKKKKKRKLDSELLSNFTFYYYYYSKLPEFCAKNACDVMLCTCGYIQILSLSKFW